VGEATDIGRIEGNIVIGDDRYISPRHARIALRGGVFFLRDLESVNGIFVRIPFEFASRGDSAQRPGRSESASAAEASKPGLERAAAVDPGASSDPNAGDSEQLLANQELFLVGQQVLRFEL
jgi:hypothetical protein